MRKRHLVSALLLFLLPIPAAADVCEDIATGADGWAALADRLDELAEAGGPSQREAEELDASIEEGVVATLELVGFLETEGNSDEQALARSLRGSLGRLEQAQTFEQIVAAMDDITGDLDAIVDYCESPEEPAPVEVAAGAVVSYDPPTPELAELAAAIAQSGVYEEVAAAVASNVELPRQLPIRFTNCGEPNAYYHPEAGEVIMCYELFAFAGSLLDPASSDEEMGNAILGTGVFFLLHELGHALVHQLDLPITGREEDSVDGLATIILVNVGSEGDALAAVDHFDTMARLMAQAGETLPFWDEHSLNEQRVYDIACLIFGSDPQAFSGLVAPDYLPAERAQRCPAEYEQKSRAWSQLLGPYSIGD